MSALAGHGIVLKRETPGEHRTACPECAGAKHRPRDEALAVKLEPDGGATWWCPRWGGKGGPPPAGEPAADRPTAAAAGRPAAQARRPGHQPLVRGAAAVEGSPPADHGL